MGVITISRQYGTEGLTIGQQVAEELGYSCVDRELIEEVAKEAHVPVAEAERFDEHPQNAVIRLVKRLITPVYPEDLSAEQRAHIKTEGKEEEHRRPFGLDEDRFVRLTKEVIERMAEHGNVVLMGRGGQALLAQKKDALHVRIFAPREYLVNNVVRSENLTKEKARERVVQVNRERLKYAERHYGIDLTRVEHYHMAINTARTGVEVSVRMLVEAARSFWN
ncbi:MAG: cytidylate kinase-like family protein [Candidatus Latescibacteria bacterium]|jgi:cytidylate kinase|nr:cytidylate kinase-like family protein [Candidatus Latescibacterota bacterium]